MLTKRIIPCLDVDAGRVVKGVNFLNLRDAGDPGELAAMYYNEGADELVFLDITASAHGRETMVDVVRRVSDQVFIPLTVGGGIRDLGDVRNMLMAGADKVSLNTAVVNDPELLYRAAQVFGSQCMVVAIDARNIGSDDKQNNGPIGLDENSRWQVYTHGGRVPMGIDVLKWAKMVSTLGAGEILLTSMDADGRLDGYDLELTRNVSEAVPIPVIASGGAGTLEHLQEAFTQGKADAVLAASIFHYGTFSIRQAKDYLEDAGTPVRR